MSQTRPGVYRKPIGLALLAFVAIAQTLLAITPAQAQLFGKAISQPYYDFGTGARFLGCRPSPYYWTFDPYEQADECEEGCRVGFTAHRPADWYSIADFAPMTYDNYDTFPLARSGPTGPTVLSTSNLEPEFDSGGRFTIGRTFGGCFQVEGTYLGAYSWCDEVAVADGTGSLSSAFSNFANPAVAGLDNNNLAVARDFNRFTSAELNVRTWINMPPGPFDVSLLVGARYMSAYEEFGFRTVSALPLPGGSQNSATVATNNDMYGVQIGIDFKWLVYSKFYFDYDLKGGVLNNFASQTTQYSHIDQNGVQTDFATGADRQRTVWFGDMMLTGNFQFRPNWTLRAGYQAIFVDGLALGPNNLQRNNTLLTAGPGQLIDDGRAVYHGPVLGLMWTR